MQKLFLIFVAMTGLNACKEDCGDNPGYTASFYITDKKTGRPYFEIDDNKVDSVKIYINGYPPNSLSFPLYKKYDSKRGYILSDIDIQTDSTITVYIYLNKSDIDTLQFNNIVTTTNERCGYFNYITKATYNGDVLPIVNSDTTSFQIFNLMK